MSGKGVAILGIFVFPESIKFLSLQPKRRFEMFVVLAKLVPGEDIPKDAVFSCPADPGGSIRVIFEYPVGEAVTVRIAMGGCRFASNGPLTAAASPQAQQQIIDLVGSDPN